MIAGVTGLDQTVTNFLVALRSPVWNDVFLSITQLGDARWITVVALAMAALAWRHRRFEYKAGLAVALFGSLLVSQAIKLLIERARPDESLALIHASGYSFPSMHAAVSFATYGFLAYMTYRLMHPPHHRAPWIFALSILIFLVGFSRIYLGVHYLSDVVAGFALGGLCLWLGILTTKRVSRYSGARG